MSDQLERPEIFDADRPIIDAHHHLFARPNLRYLLDDYLADLTSGHRIVASVFVEAGAYLRPDGPEALKPLGEVEFANGVGAMARGGYFGGAAVCAGIVGKADLGLGDGLASLLDRCIQAAPDRFRGVRQMALDHVSSTAFRLMPQRPPPGLLRDAAFRQGLRLVGERGLTFDLTVFHEQFADCAELVDSFPDIVFVLNHMGMVMGLDSDLHGLHRLRREWDVGLRELAKRPNVVCKIGGLGMPIWGFAPVPESAARESAVIALWRPYIETAIEAFGANRCMFESNFPIDRAWCDYRTLWNVFKRIAASASESDRNSLCYGTAARVYRIAIPVDASTWVN